jgi:hypothetical protein
LQRKRTTFGVTTKNRTYAFQPSTKDPFWIPSIKKYDDSNFTIMGWLFVYVAWSPKRIYGKTNENVLKEGSQ